MCCAVDGCAQIEIAYNSCRNRHCPKCQASAAQRWLEARQADLLPVEYYHVVFTLPAPISAIAYYNKAVIYGLLFDVAAETLRTIAADPKHLGAQIGATLVLHTWGSALTHHPHVHGIVPGGGLSPDGERWVACRPGFFLPVRVLSRLFRRRFLEELAAAHRARPAAVLRRVRRARRRARLRRLARAAARSASGSSMPSARSPDPRRCSPICRATRIAWPSPTSRLVALDERGVTFRWKDYRAKGRTRYKTMTLEADEFMRRFLLHVLPGGFHRIRHYGLLANPGAPRRISRRYASCCTSRRRRQPPPPMTPPRQLAADLRLPALRRADDHHRDPPAQRTDPRTTRTASRSMSARVQDVQTDCRLFGNGTR